MSNWNDIPGNRDPKVRASDADREAIAEILRTQHAEGRLDSEEMQERIDACYQAKTVGELDQLLDDLPRPERAEHDRPRFGFPRRKKILLALVPILITIGVVSSLAGGDGHEHHFFWLAIPLFFLATRFFAPWCKRRRGGRGRSGRRWA
jgi:hypothetical protein